MLTDEQLRVLAELREADAVAYDAMVVARRALDAAEATHKAALMNVEHASNAYQEAVWEYTKPRRLEGARRA